jgi:hypothetical protein
LPIIPLWKKEWKRVHICSHPAVDNGFHRVYIVYLVIQNGVHVHFSLEMNIRESEGIGLASPWRYWHRPCVVLYVVCPFMAEFSMRQSIPLLQRDEMARSKEGKIFDEED